MEKEYEISTFMQIFSGLLAAGIFIFSIYLAVNKAMLYPIFDRN